MQRRVKSQTFFNCRSNVFGLKRKGSFRESGQKIYRIANRVRRRLLPRIKQKNNRRHQLASRNDTLFLGAHQLAQKTIVWFLTQKKDEFID